MCTPNDIARNFVQTYYANLDRIDFRGGLASVYRDFSSMLYEGKEYVGGQQIMEKLMSLPPNLARVISAVDTLVIDERTLLINVIGQQRTDQQNDHPLPFCQTLLLVKDSEALMIVKEINRLCLHDV